MNQFLNLSEKKLQVAEHTITYTEKEKQVSNSLSNN